MAAYASSRQQFSCVPLTASEDPQDGTTALGAMLRNDSPTSLAYPAYRSKESLHISPLGVYPDKQYPGVKELDATGKTRLGHVKGERNVGRVRWPLRDSFMSPGFFQRTSRFNEAIKSNRLEAKHSVVHDLWFDRRKNWRDAHGGRFGLAFKSTEGHHD